MIYEQYWVDEGSEVVTDEMQGLTDGFLLVDGR